MRWKRLLWPHRIATQIAACVILALLLSQLVTAWLLIVQDAPRGAPPIALAADRVALVIAMLDAMPEADRRGIRARLRQLHVRIDPEITGVFQDPDPAPLSNFRSVLQERVGNPFTLWLAKPEQPGLPARLIVDASLADGGKVRVEAEVAGPGSVFMFALGRFFLPAVTVALIVLTLWATRRITAPLRAFSEAAEQLGNERSAPPLPETGPIELQRAARSFNKMQEQVKRFVEDRTRMLAAISHDLRTPITRLRLRVEAEVENVSEQQKMVQDLDQMDAMVSSALSFLRDGAHDAPMARVDLASLLQSSCDEFADMGFDVRYLGPAHLPVHCRPRLLTRAVTNLVENATKYGTVVTVDLTRDSNGNAIVDIDDHGPGIPDAEKAKAFDPFYRLDAARGADSGGFGLGLSIARTLVELHGGQIELMNRIPTGTRVVMTLPLSSN